MRPLLATLLFLLPFASVRAQPEALTLAVLPGPADDDLTNPACCAMEVGAAALLYLAVGYSDGKSLADTDMKVAAGLIAGAALCTVGACIADQRRLGAAPTTAVARWRVQDGTASALAPTALAAGAVQPGLIAPGEASRLVEIGRALGADLLMVTGGHEERSGVGLGRPEGEPQMAMAVLDVRMGAWVLLDDAPLPSARVVRPRAEVEAAGGPAAWAAAALNRPGLPATR